MKLTSLLTFLSATAAPALAAPTARDTTTAVDASLINLGGINLRPRPYRPGSCAIPRTSPAYCAGTNPDPTKLATYVCGDFRLGPIRLPRRLPLDAVLDIYDRFGGLCPGEFLATFWDPVAAWWRYPDEDGFSIDTSGDRIDGRLVLAEGILLDRFGGEGGGYVSPAAAPYMQRSLPPTNLDTPQDAPEFPYNYRVYRVMSDLEVTAGPIAPWFGQPGQGVQYKLDTSVGQLIAAGVLKREDPRAILSRRAAVEDAV